MRSPRPSSSTHAALTCGSSSHSGASRPVNARAPPSPACTRPSLATRTTQPPASISLVSSCTSRSTRPTPASAHRARLRIMHAPRPAAPSAAQRTRCRTSSPPSARPTHRPHPRPARPRPSCAPSRSPTATMSPRHGTHWRSSPSKHRALPTPSAALSSKLCASKHLAPSGPGTRRWPCVCSVEVYHMIHPRRPSTYEAPRLPACRWTAARKSTGMLDARTSTTMPRLRGTAKRRA